MNNKEFLKMVGKSLLNTGIAMGGLLILFYMLKIMDWLIGFKK